LLTSEIRNQPDEYNIHIRAMKIEDLHNLHKMYDSLSYTTKRFFHPGFLGFEKLNPGWFIFQLGLVFSTNSGCKKAMAYILPQLIFISIVATSAKNEIVGFAFIKVKKRSRNRCFVGELGIAVRDEHQGRGIGEKLMSQLIACAMRENVERIDLITLTDNLKAIKLYKKHGFVQHKIIKGRDNWGGQLLDSIEMTLHLGGRTGKGCE
jgi:ribosomal protein S18 acetylase RimI-like enzyme